MSEDYLEFNFLDVDDSFFLGQNEEIICKNCVVISFIACESKDEKEVIDFSAYDFKKGKGFVLWSCYYSGKGTTEMTVHPNCMVSQKIHPDGHSEFFWWPAGTITFFKE